MNAEPGRKRKWKQNRSHQCFWEGGWQVRLFSHGASNNFEYTVIGTNGAATWRFLQPDEVEFGTGNRTFIIRRQAPNESSGSSPFHGLGWLEGYVEITRQTLRAAAGFDSVPVPTLQESLATMKILLNAL